MKVRGHELAPPPWLFIIMWLGFSLSLHFFEFMRKFGLLWKLQRQENCVHVFVFIIWNCVFSKGWSRATWKHPPVIYSTPSWSERCKRLNSQGPFCGFCKGRLIRVFSAPELYILLCDQLNLFVVNRKVGGGGKQRDICSFRTSKRKRGKTFTPPKGGSLWGYPWVHWGSSFFLYEHIVITRKHACST